MLRLIVALKQRLFFYSTSCPYISLTHLCFFPGEPCTMYHYNNMAESGICMIDCQIPIPKGKPFPCLPSQYGCCPRDYEPPNNNSDNSTFTITKTLFNMTDPKIAKRYNYF